MRFNVRKAFSTVTSLENIKMRLSGKKPALTEVQDMAIDLGTANGSIYSGDKFGHLTIEDVASKEQHDVMHIRTLIACRSERKELSESDLRKKNTEQQKHAQKNLIIEPDTREADVEAIGHEAYERWGRTPELTFIKAVERGNVGHVQAYRAVLRYLIRMRYPGFEWSFKNLSRKPRILIGIPHNATSRHIETIKSVISNDIGAIPVLVYEQIAAAVGAAIPFEKPKSCGIADIGGGTTDFAVLSKGRVVNQVSCSTAGDDVDKAIMAYLSTEPLNIDIGHRTAIAIKEAIGSAMPLDEKKDTEPHDVKGASFATQMPGTISVTAKEIREKCVLPIARKIADDFRQYLSSLVTYSEVHGDIEENGFYLTGGTSEIPGLAEFLQNETGIKICKVASPMTSVIDGLVIMLKNDTLLKLGLAAA